MKYFNSGLETLVIFGVNQLACVAVRYCLDHDIAVHVFSGERMRDREFWDLEDKDFQGFKTCAEWIEAQGVQIDYKDKISVNDVQPLIQGQTAGFSFDSPFIIKQPFIDLFNGAIFNEHGAALPMGKGGGSYSWRILEDDREGYVVFHELTEEIDGGNLVWQQGFVFPASCRKPGDFSLHQYSQNKQALIDFLGALKENKDLSSKAQQDRFSTYFPRLNTAMNAFIDWSWSAQDILNFILAFSDPFEGAKSFIDDNKIFIKDAYLDQKVRHTHPFKWGIVFNIYDDHLHIACKDATLIVTDYSFEDAKAKIHVGDRLYTPPGYIQQSLSSRAVYLPKGLKQAS